MFFDLQAGLLSCVSGLQAVLLTKPAKGTHQQVTRQKMSSPTHSDGNTVELDK